MEKLTLNSCGRDYPIMFVAEQYEGGNGLCIRMITDADGFIEPYANLTVSPSNNPTNENCAFVNTNNLGNDIIFWLMDNELGQLTGWWGYSGYCSYPEFEFNMNEVEKYLFDKKTYVPTETSGDEDSEENDYEEPYDIDDDIGYNPYMGCNDWDC